jgi:hypothetical protein
MRGTNVRRRWWSTAVAAAELYPRKDVDGTVVYDFKLHELRHTAASLTIQAGANITAPHNKIGLESAGLKAFEAIASCDGVEIVMRGVNVPA